jgi:hypothetical protein
MSASACHISDGNSLDFDGFVLLCSDIQGMLLG